MPADEFSVSMPKERCLKLRSLHSPWMFLMNMTMNVDVDARQYAPAAEGNSLDEDANRVQAQYEASKSNAITCLPNSEERCVYFLKEEEVVSAERHYLRSGMSPSIKGEFVVHLDPLSRSSFPVEMNPPSVRHRGGL